MRCPRGAVGNEGPGGIATPQETPQLSCFIDKVKHFDDLAQNAVLEGKSAICCQALAAATVLGRT